MRHDVSLTWYVLFELTINLLISIEKKNNIKTQYYIISVGPFSSSLRDCDVDDLDTVTKSINSYSGEDLVRSLTGFSLYSSDKVD